MERSEVIARAAAELREWAGLPEPYKAGELVFGLCRQLKLKWTEGGSGVMLGGAYSRLQLWAWDKPEKGGGIWLRPGLSRELRAFAVAHELGHYLLHRGEGLDLHPACDAEQVNEQADPAGLRRLNHRVEEYTPRAYRELEANAFAAELLVPRAEVRRLFATRSDGDATWLAAHFGISPALAQQRLVDAVFSSSVKAESQHVSQPFPAPAPSQPEDGSADNIIAQLDHFQQAAARADGPALVIAGPGTGKTATLVGRVAHLIEERHLQPERILALTFSNRAAGEMRERLERSHLPGERMPVMTLHAFAAALLRSYAARVPTGPGEQKLDPDFRILDRTDAFLLMEDLLGELPLHFYRSLNTPTIHLDTLQENFSQARDRLITPGKYLELVERMPPIPPLDELATSAAEQQPDKKTGGKAKRQPPPGTYTQEQIARARERANAYAVWDRALRARGLVDFGGLIQRAVELLAANPDVLAEVRQRYPEILVDEFQDTNFAQAVLLLLIAGDAGSGLWVVGDRNQSIYRWRGAAPSNLTRLREFYPHLHIHPLRRSYRSVPAIVALGSEMAARMAAHSSPADAQLRPDYLGALEAHRQEGRLPAVLRCDSFLNEAHEEAGLIEAIRRHRQQGVSYKQQAILCRTHRQTHRLANALAAAGIPVSQVGHFFERDEVKDTLALLSLAVGPDVRGLLRARELIAGLGYPPPAKQEIAAVIKTLVAWQQTLPGALSDTALLREIAILSPSTRAGLAALGDLAQRLRYHFSPEESHLGISLASTLLRPGGYAWQIARVADGLIDAASSETAPLAATASQARAQGALAALGELIRIVTRFDGRWKREPDFRLRLSRAVSRSQKHARPAAPLQTEETPPEPPALAPAAACFMHYLRALHLTDQHLAIPIGEEDAVHILTAHTSKGLEFPVVYLPMLAKGQFPGSSTRHEVHPPGFREQDAQTEEQEEERCLFYVGVTRAQDVVVLTRATSYRGKNAQKSPLLALVDDALPDGQILPLYAPDELAALAGPITEEKRQRASSDGEDGEEDDDKKEEGEEDGEKEVEGRPSNHPPLEASAAPKQVYSLSDLLLYDECPRQYKYARRYGLLDPAQDAARRFHLYLHRGRGELRRVHSAHPKAPWDEVEQRLRLRWEEDGAAGHAYDQFYWQHAQHILRAEWKKLAAEPTAPASQPITLAQDVTVTLNRCTVRVRADQVAGGPAAGQPQSAPTVLTRVYARRARQSDEQDLHLPLYYLAHWQQSQQTPVRIEAAYLGNVLADVAPIPGSMPESDVLDRTEKARKDVMDYLNTARSKSSKLAKLDKAAAGIEAGEFPIRPAEKRCLACPFCYVCPADPDAD